MSPTPSTASDPRPRARTGAYSYWCNGASAEVVETWRLEPLSHGGVHITSQRQAPAAGVTLTVEAEAEAGGPGVVFGPVRRFTAAWQPTGAGTWPAVRATYARAAGGFTIRRAVFGAHAEEAHHALAGPVVFSPLMRIFQGPVIRRVAELGQGAPVPVVMPWIVEARDTQRLLTPHLDARSARRLRSVTVQLPWSPAPLAAERYSYCGDRYDEAAEFDLDAEALLLRYAFRESAERTWEVYSSTCTRPA